MVVVVVTVASLLVSVAGDLAVLERPVGELLPAWDAGGGDGDIRAALERCMMDEAHHRDDAAGRRHGKITTVERLWRWIVGSGSAMAVVVAKRL